MEIVSDADSPSHAPHLPQPIATKTQISEHKQTGAPCCILSHAKCGYINPYTPVCTVKTILIGKSEELMVVILSDVKSRPHPGSKSSQWKCCAAPLCVCVFINKLYTEVFLPGFVFIHKSNPEAVKMPEVQLLPRYWKWGSSLSKHQVLLYTT